MLFLVIAKFVILASVFPRNSTMYYRVLDRNYKVSVTCQIDLAFRIVYKIIA